MPFDLRACTLPTTGSQFATMATVAALAIVAGVLLHRMGTRRRLGAALGIAALGMIGLVQPPAADAADSSTFDLRVCQPAPSAAVISRLPLATVPMIGETTLEATATVSVELSGFAPKDFVQLVVASVSEVIDADEADGNGTVQLSGTIPSDASPGPDELVVYSPATGVGIRQPIVIASPGTTQTTENVEAADTSSSTSTTEPATTTTTAAPPMPPPVPASPTTTVPAATTTTIPMGWNPTQMQSIWWRTKTNLYLSDSPFTPPAPAATDWSATFTFSVADPGTTACTVDPTTGTITYTAVGDCSVRVTTATTPTYLPSSNIVTFTVHPTPVCDQSLNYSVGQTGPGGGVVFYVSPTCEFWGKYLEIATTSAWSTPDEGSWPRPHWCDNKTDVGAYDPSLGAGWGNTLTIMEHCTESAAALATGYQGGNRVDWFLPSEAEQVEVCKFAFSNSPSATTCTSTGNYVNNNQYGFIDHYWSSTEWDSNSARQTWMPGGHDWRTTDKQPGHVGLRPIRAFGLAEHLGASLTPAVLRSTSRTVDFTVSFSESVSGLAANDFENLGTAPGCVFTPASSSGVTVSVQAVCTGDGTLVANLKPGSVVFGASSVGPQQAVNSSMVPIDSIAPTITTSSGPIVVGSGIAVTSDELATAYLVDSSIVVGSATDITSAATNLWNSVSITTPGATTSAVSSDLVPGIYRIYVIDLAGNVSGPSAGITIRTAQACTTDCLLGDIGPGGGVVFYDAGSVQSWGRYLELAPGTWRGGTARDGDYPRPTWCNIYDSDITGATNSAIGTGWQNSLAILAGCTESPAATARNYRGGGQVDWFLPSEMESKAMCRYVYGNAPGIETCTNTGGYINSNALELTDHYWTSTQTSFNSALQPWLHGANDYRQTGKDATHVSLRPIRAFGGPDVVDAAITPLVLRTTSRTVDFTVEFSSSVTGLTSSDFTNTGTAPGCVFTPGASSGASVSVQAVCSGDGTIVAELAPNSVTAGSVSGPGTAVNSSMVPIDSIAPVVSMGSGTVVRGTAFSMALSEPSTVYLVDDSLTISGAASLAAVADAQMNSIDVPLERLAIAALHTAGLDAGTYRLYAVDLAGNVSQPSSTTFTVRAPQNCTTACLVGDIGPGGGTVFYAAATPQSWGQFLEAAPGNWRGGTASDHDWPRQVWCDVNNSDITGATGTAIGTGWANTQAIIAACGSSTAASVAAYRGGSLSDWFLPSEDELLAQCRWIHGVPADVSTCRNYSWGYLNNDNYTDHYWSSTQLSAGGASQMWVPGENDIRHTGKDATHVSARPVRMFGLTSP